LEPEGFESDIVYPNGISTSLPIEIQHEFVRKIKGLENVEIIQAGYAVEYDCIDPRVLKSTLESKDHQGLFFAGQINGTSGYEEAAGQGILAGINAAHFVLNKDKFTLSRSEAYIGVMVDDLITNGVDEPYRMFTSRAEFRLSLREDNAALRLLPKAKELRLLLPDQLERTEKVLNQYTKIKEHLSSTKAKPNEATNIWLKSIGSSEIKDSIKLSDLVRRPELTLDLILKQYPCEENLIFEIVEALQTELKFEGYLKRQHDEINRILKAEKEAFPANFCFDNIHNLRIELREKLKKHRPETIAQAMKIPGMTPSALSVLAINIKSKNNQL
jgi:tRNA uridine 5-carboxymethylaminomethyl modification enzyme